MKNRFWKKVYWWLKYKFDRTIEIYCVLFGHKEKHCGSEMWTEYGHEYDDWWECARCDSDLSNYYDLTTFSGRLKSWWYQE